MERHHLVRHSHAVYLQKQKFSFLLSSFVHHIVPDYASQGESHCGETGNISMYLSTAVKLVLRS